MIKTLLIIVVAASGGYYYGFHDAKTHSRPVLNRVVDGAVSRTGGSSRRNVTNDIDAQMRQAER